MRYNSFNTRLLFTLFLLAGSGFATAESVNQKLVDTFVALSGGPHEGYRVNHAKGIVASGTFTPSDSAKSITRAPHMQNANSDIVVRFSNATGSPDSDDAAPSSFPKGMSIRLLLDDGGNTDMVLLSVNRFPVSTPEKFLEMLTAVKNSHNSQQEPKPIETFLEQNPSAKRFVEMEKPAPESYTTQSYHGLNAFEFTNSDGDKVFGRYIVEPVHGEQFLNQSERDDASRNYLQSALREQLEDGSALMKISLQLAEAGDVTNDPTVVWPDDRKVVELGVLEINAIMKNGEDYARSMMFNPLALTDGIAPSDDPVLLARPGAYALSFQKRAE